ncbi:MAG TPA: TIGR02391 family protein [Edaphobacter sp.]|nr:TIGR02391 family protein [Edaphobacter sp.]
MTLEQIRIEIARTVCHNYLDLHQPTQRHALVNQFENVDLLSEMETRTLLRARNNRQEYLPSSGSFVLLPSDDDLEQRAENAFVVTVRALRHLFKTGNFVEGSAAGLADMTFEEGNRRTKEEYALGLYLCLDFGVLGTHRVSEDGMSVESFVVSEGIVRIKDAALEWGNRRAIAQNAVPVAGVPIEYLRQAMIDNDFERFGGEESEESFWNLLHPNIIPEARRRFRARLYAEAVEAALKVVQNMIREKTGLTVDGTALMNEAFSPSNPRLTFDLSGSPTARSMQEGYHFIFKGSILAVRNPKAHGFVEIDATRCIHFLYLASLLAFKTEEADDTPRASG